VEARASSNNALESGKLLLQLKPQGSSQGNLAMAQHSRFLLIILICRKTMADNYFYFFKFQASHQCFSNSGCCRSGMNSHVWTTLPQRRFIQQMQRHLSVSGKGLANAWCGAWLDHPSFHVRWLDVSTTSATCVRQSGRVPLQGGRHMTANLYAPTIIQLLLVCLLPFLLLAESK
jgi:hypothetical protein